MASPIDISVKKPITVIMVIIAICILGFISLSRLSIDFFPNIEFPVLAVSTSYSGAGPQEVEKAVTRVIEGAVGGVSDIDNITSTSSEGQSVVIINFKWGASLESAASDVREKLDLIKDALPDDAGKPIVFKFSPAMLPVMAVGLSGIDNLEYLYDLADTQVKTKLEQVPGVANVNIAGGLKKEIHINVSRNRLQAYGLDISTITRLLMIENQNVAGGVTYDGVYKYVLRTVGEFKDLDDIRNVILTVKRGIPVRLQDIATVEYSHSEDTGIVRLNGKPGLTLYIYKEAGLNTVQVASDVEKRLEEITASLPPGVTFNKIFDSAQSIKRSINSVRDAALQGAIFAVFILMLYLWNIRTVLIIGISIPTSIITTFILMYFMDVNLNIISLSGLALGVGMMVDSSIVVLENIFFHRQKGAGKYSASVNGAKEMSLAVSASTFTTIAVFFPFLFVEGLTSQLFRDLAITVSVSLLSSLAVSLTIIPMLASKMISLKENNLLRPFEEFFTKRLTEADEFYANILGKALRHKKAFIGITIPAVLIVGFVLTVFVVGKEGFPQMDEGQFRINATFPVGTRVEYTDRIMKRIEKDVMRIAGENTDTILTTVKGGGLFSALRGASDNKGSIRVNLVPVTKRTTSQFDIIERIRKQLRQYPAKINVSVEGVGGRMMGGGAPITIEVKGDDLETADNLSKKIKQVISEVDGVREPEIDREEGLPELIIRINRGRAAKVGLNAMNISQAIKTSFGGQIATRIKSKSGTDVDVSIRLRENDRKTIDDVLSLSLPAPTGALVPLRAIANVEKAYGPTGINRKDSMRIVTITADIYGRATEEVVSDIKRSISEKVYVPNGFSIIYGGSYKDMVESFSQLALAFLLAAVLVYAIMASQFESVIAPFVIMFAVPFGAVGSVMLLSITGRTLNIISAAGIVVLVGIVINNGIVLVDYINQLLREWMLTHETKYRKTILDKRREVLSNLDKETVIKRLDEIATKKESILGIDDEDKIDEFVSIAKERCSHVEALPYKAGKYSHLYTVIKEACEKIVEESIKDIRISHNKAYSVEVDKCAKEAGFRRFRPVSMTTLTTILGLLPMALGIGEGAELYSPMSTSILGGLLISTVFTLVIVPTVYAGIRKRFPLDLREDLD